jgi:Fic family protein
VSTPFVPRGVVYRDEEEKIRLESRNGAIQADFVVYTAHEWRPGDQVTPELLKKLQELAITQMYRCAGNFRNGAVMLEGVAHTPPDHKLVPSLVDEMCAYINGNWTKPAVHLASYAMWRLNWIHPFFGGNGRTARAFSYLVLCAGLGFALPAGDKTIPELIVENREPYYEALRSADDAWTHDRLDLSAMEDFIGSLLAKQLLAVHELATGKRHDA